MVASLRSGLDAPAEATLAGLSARADPGARTASAAAKSAVRSVRILLPPSIKAIKSRIKIKKNYQNEKRALAVD
jgi:hypothetical protein